MGWKENKRAQGFKDMLIWLSPAAVTAMEKLKASSPGASAADIISRAVAQAAGGVPEVAGQDVGGPDHALVLYLEERIEAVENRLGEMEHNFCDFKDDEDFQDKQAIRERLDALEESLKPAARAGDGGEKWSLEQSSQSSPSNEAIQGPAPRKRIEKRTVVDKALLLRLVADKVSADGWDFGKMEFGRELIARGLPVYQNPNHISTWITKHHDDIVAELAKRRAAGGDA